VDSASALPDFRTPFRLRRQHRTQHRPRKTFPFPPPARPGTCDIQHGDPVSLHEPPNRRDCLRLRHTQGIDQESGPAVLAAQSQRERRPAAELTGCQDHRAIAVVNIPSRTRPIASARELCHRILLWDASVFRLPPGRALPATRETHRERGIECAAIHAGLSAGDDFEK